MSVEKSAADIIFDRANVALARSQQLVASWLPASDDDENVTPRKSDAELQREEDEVFVAVPEKLGLGAPVPSKEADATAKRSELSSNEKLRQQLMGKNYKRAMTAAKSNSKQHQHSDKGPSSNKATAANEDDGDDDEPSRSSLGKKKRNHVMVEKDLASASDLAPVSSRVRRGGSYLDEVLAQRAKKKKKTSSKEST